MELEKLASGSWLLQAISILPEYRGRGFASDFLSKADEVAKAKGASSITLQVEEINKIALKTYIKFGYSEVSRRELIPFSFSDDTGEIILMQKSL